MPLRILLHLLFFNFAISAKDSSFLFNGFRNADLSLSGGSYIKANGVLAVTNYTSRILGHAFYPSPLQFKDNSTRTADVFSFSTNFVFSLSPKYPNLGGHGLAFLFSSSTDLKGALINQYLGLPNTTSNGNLLNHFLAVEFDIVQNLELGDINDNHVGIDIDSIISIVSQTAAYLTGNRPNNKHVIDMKSGVSVQAWVEYSSREKLLNVTISPLREPRPSLPLISFPVNLATIFEEYMYVGFSASTGLLTAEHNLLGWSLRTDGPAQDLDPSELPNLSPPHKVVNSKGFAVGIALACTTLVFLGIFASYQMVRRLKSGDEELEDWEIEYGSRRYDYSELSAATRGFGDKNLIGSGGFGSVYKGVIPSTRIEVAIKRIAHDSRQGMKEFVAEITSVGRLRHRNLVQLHGWCRRKDELLLVYDYVPNGSLDKLLFNPKKPLAWDERFKILKGVAQALLYLHEECDQRVLHRDIKASNILIDADFNAKLGDFGLARIYEHDIHPQTTHIVGTLGYLAPELTRTGKATTSTDVFSYGTLALEMACGRRPIDPQNNAFELVLLDWVKELYSRGEVMKAVDPRLDQYDPDEMELTMHLGLLCSHPLPNHRPSMRRVVQFLLGDATLPPLPPEIHLENFNMMAEFSDSYADTSDPSSYRVNSSKSTSSLSSFDGKVIGALGSRSTY
ncbi:L-type lectin-domain containing receptor kinase SIT1-like [Aristolochia californica]|uniref:L-type lectin-domain containing receptor kinase SIT1-like n=1 Tax=Aristolochia californica TaxID=171875 RepID=UPI0035DA9256